MPPRRSTTSKTTAAKPDVSHRIVVLHGQEEMLKKEHLDALRQALAKAHGEVESLVFEGKTVELAQVFDELRGFGLMQQHKLIIVDEADQFVTRFREPLERYAQAPVDSATLVLRGTRWNRGNLDKAIAKVGVLLKCDPLKRPEAARWLAARAKRVHGALLDQQTSALLVDRLGGDMMRLDSEVAKLAVMVAKGQPITSDMIDQVVGRGSDADAWAVQEAVLQAIVQPPARPGTAAAAQGTAGGQAIAKIHELVDLSGQPDVLVTYFVADLFRKLYLAAAMKRQGTSDAQIGKELKLWGPRQQLFMSLLRRLSPRAAGRLFDRIVEYDARAKTGRGDPLRNLECFCAALADEVQ